MHEFKVRATVVGDAAVAAGMALSLKGTGYFDQTFDIDTVSPGLRHVGAHDAPHGALRQEGAISVVTR
ncbi:hypothetical protein [Bradyrhizobium sp. 33ap4]|uniref:hypothetical protein n=1 Tax=Bradyrhizobium sp. 33ap4 TaxID=3061630 RepID=UPI00292CE849|nr:hypothetical protein [Bradyrhizobium sp. 33ap4]